VGSNMCEDFSDCSQKSSADRPHFLRQDPERRALDGVSGENCLSLLLTHSFIDPFILSIHPSIIHLSSHLSVIYVRAWHFVIQKHIPNAYVPGTGDPRVKAKDTLTFHRACLWGVGGVTDGT